MEALVDLCAVPQRAVLVLEQDELAAGPDACVAARVLKEHQREQPEHLGLVGHQHGKELPEANRVVAQVTAHELLVGGRRVAFVEDEVEDREHRLQPLGEQMVGRDAERNARVADLPLRPHESLRQRRLGDEERARDLGRLKAADFAERQGDSRLRRERRMAAGEHQAQPLVGDRAHVVVLLGSKLL